MDYESNIHQRIIVYFGIFLWFTLFTCSIHAVARAITGVEYQEFSDIKDVTEFREKIEKEANEIKAYNHKYNQKIKFLDARDEIENLKDQQLEGIVSHNSRVNNKRREGSRQAIGFILAGLPPLFMSGTIFLIYDLDTSSPRKNTLTQDTNLAKSVDQLNMRIETIHANQRRIEMTTDEAKKSSESNNPTTQQTPPKPQQLPQKPKPQIVVENFKPSADQKSKCINEGGGK